MSAVCIQRPRMGSSQPPDGNMPFGYHISDHIPDHVPDQDFMFLRPPTPPPGDPLLSHDDSRLLNLFFEDMTSNQYPSYGEGLNYSDQWISQLPPAFLGHTTSFGQQPQQPSASPINGIPPATFQDVFTFGQNMMPPPPQPPLQLSHAPQHQHHAAPTPHTPIEQSTHADVAAVLTSLHHGHQNGHTHNTNGVTHTHVVPSHHGAAPVDRMRSLPRNHISPERNNPVRHRHAPSNESDTIYADMMFGNPQGLTNQRQIETPELQWGSDSSFARAQGYVPPDHESSDLLEQKRLGVLKVFSISDSTTTTRPSSPLPNGECPPNPRRDSILNGHVKEECDTEAPPAKRRKSKSKAKEEVEEVEDLISIPPKTVARKRKSKADLKAAAEPPSIAPDTPGKRRKSTLNAAKAARENLTDAQKRENHIKSEQKRRGAIKEGFEDLGEIVPNLKGGGYSKSAMLSLAGEWLEALLKGNAELEKL